MTTPCDVDRLLNTAQAVVGNRRRVRLRRELAELRDALIVARANDHITPARVANLTAWVNQVKHAHNTISSTPR